MQSYKVDDTCIYASLHFDFFLIMKNISGHFTLYIYRLYVTRESTMHSFGSKIRRELSHKSIILKEKKQNIIKIPQYNFGHI